MTASVAAAQNSSASSSRPCGVPIVVRKSAPMRNETAAHFWLRGPQQVAEFLALFADPREPADGGELGEGE